MNCTVYYIKAMDCSSEEHMVRMCLEGINDIKGLSFDLPGRQLTVYHVEGNEEITNALVHLGLGAEKREYLEDVVLPIESQNEELRPLQLALAINGLLFVGELAVGLWASSMGLIADSLDMLADALVYALSLVAVGAVVARKKQVARWSGYLQIGLAGLGLLEVFRRFFATNRMPDTTAMISISLIALAGNVATLMLLRNTRKDEAHIQASWIFTSNDIKVNMLVIVTAGMVWITRSYIPDLVVGGLIFLIVANGARRIFALSR